MLRARQRLDKYRVVRRIAQGGFATVYEAVDTVEGISVALKVPHSHLVTKATLDDFRREVRHTARLDHPHIVPIKTAGHVDGRFVIVQPLGQGTLHDRLSRRVALKTALAWSEQILAALAYAHGKHIVHCDVKPENILLFADGGVRLADFGISKVAQRTLVAGGTGTVGYVAPEQAMGRPSLRSDVFSAGLVLWRLFSGRLPEWPYRAPLPGADRLRKLHPDLLKLLCRALEVDEGKRFRDAGALLAAFRRVRVKILSQAARQRRRRNGGSIVRQDWRAVRQRQFRRAHGSALDLRHTCGRCHGPITEAMTSCPWCGKERKIHRAETSFPAHCPRCRRGVKRDWTYCAWCYGGAIGPSSERTWPDKRYTTSCQHCRGKLMPFMRYCPHCRRKTTQRWKLASSRARCPRCEWGVAHEFWEHCPWCARRLARPMSGPPPRKSGRGR